MGGVPAAHAGAGAESGKPPGARRGSVAAVGWHCWRMARRCIGAGLVAAALPGSHGALVARAQSGSHRTRGHCARAGEGRTEGGGAVQVVTSYQ